MGEVRLKVPIAAVILLSLAALVSVAQAAASSRPEASDLEDADLADALLALPQSDPQAAGALGLSLSRMNGAIRWLVRTLNTTRINMRQTEARLRAEIARTKASLSEALARETLRAKAAEARLTPLWMARSINATAVRNDRTEQTRAISVEQSLGVAIENASAFSIARDLELSTLISSEAERAMTKEASIQSNVNEEVTRAQLAEAHLSSAISLETSRAMGVEGTISGTLAALSTCPANAEGAPNCACVRGTTGALMWTGTSWTGVCATAPCPANSNGAPSCTCNPGYAGSLAWSGSAWTGTCNVMPCPANAQGSPASCTCGAGYTGAISWMGSAWNGSCTAAACPANAVGAPSCACASGFTGNLTWSNSAWQGTCVAVPQLISMASGRTHTCAVLPSGRVRCWGSDESGQLGLSVTGSYQYSPAAEIAGLQGVVKLAVSTQHTCAVRSTGSLLCWGGNGNGRLGVSPQDTPFTNIPRIVESYGNSVVDVCAGNGHTCALYDSGAVRCWGRNNHGQLGFNTGGSDFTSVPVTAPLVTGMKQISCGDFFTAAVHETGAIFYFGQHLGQSNFFGTVGNIGVAGRVSCGSNFCCALNSDPVSSVSCWGSRSNVVIFEGSSGFAPFGTAPALNFPSSIVSIATGATHACVSLADGTARCWGNNNLGQLGVGSTTDMPGTMATPAIANVKAIFSSSSSYTTCVSLTTGGFNCWGFNDFGQTGLGNGAQIVNAPNAAPILI